LVGKYILATEGWEEREKCFLLVSLPFFFVCISLGSGGFNQPGFEQERYFKHSIVLGEQKKQFVVSVAIC
jgi:hypothetical protein|tara:strand:+ start:732 stop:941 length:210 start_codon:yes stop_codon:yes gene_type:complete